MTPPNAADGDAAPTATGTATPASVVEVEANAPEDREVAPAAGSPPVLEPEAEAKKMEIKKNSKEREPTRILTDLEQQQQFDSSTLCAALAIDEIATFSPLVDTLVMHATVPPLQQTKPTLVAWAHGPETPNDRDRERAVLAAALGVAARGLRVLVLVPPHTATASVDLARELLPRAVRRLPGEPFVWADTKYLRISNKMSLSLARSPIQRHATGRVVVAAGCATPLYECPEYDAVIVDAAMDSSRDRIDWKWPPTGEKLTTVVGLSGICRARPC